MKHFIVTVIFILSLVSAFTVTVEAGWCCERTALFLPIKMPKGQKVDVTSFISDMWYGALSDSEIRDCPLKYAEDHYIGRKNLNKMVQDISKIVKATDPVSDKIDQLFLDEDYVWKATLTLNHTHSKIEKTESEEYAGAKSYEGGDIYGNWTFHIQLLNIHFNDVVREGSITFDGKAKSRFYRQLARSRFSPIDDIILEYEKVPRSAELKAKENELCPGDTTVINLTKIHDSKGENAKPWQRVVVEVKEGKILNGVKCSDTEKHYAFLVDNGNVEIQYKAPDIYDKKKDTITVYNACEWGREDVRPIRVTSPIDKIAETEITFKTPEHFNIQYHHTLTYTYGQFLLKSMGKGKIPCTINWQESPPSIKCDGKVSADWKGHAGPCKFEGDSSFGVHYKGNVLLTEDQPTKVIIEKAADEELGGDFNIICPGITQNVPADFPIPAVEEDRKLEFDLKSGGGKSFSVPGGTTYSYSIDLKCKKNGEK